MAPELHPGDRIVVDTSRHWPTLGELFVLWDGNSIVIKRYERVWGFRAAHVPTPLRRPLPPALCLSRIRGPIPGQGVVGHTHSVTATQPVLLDRERSSIPNACLAQRRRIA